jgi:hypothetical protein
MAIRYSNTRRTSVAAAWVTGFAFCDIYTGTQPAQNGAPTGTLLGTIADVVWSAGAAGVSEITSWTPGTAAASGTPGYGRFRNADGTHFFDGAYGSEFTLVGGGEIIQGGTLDFSATPSHTVPTGSG